MNRVEASAVVQQPSLADEAKQMDPDDQALASQAGNVYEMFTAKIKKGEVEFPSDLDRGNWNKCHVAGEEVKGPANYSEKPQQLGECLYQICFRDDDDPSKVKVVKASDHRIVTQKKIRRISTFWVDNGWRTFYP